MTKFSKHLCVLMLFFVYSFYLNAQSDSVSINNKVVKGEMNEMVQKLDAFLAIEANGKSTSVNENVLKSLNKYKDSINLVLTSQQQDIYYLKQRIKALEEKKTLAPEVVSNKFENVAGVIYFDIGSFELSAENKLLVKDIVSKYGTKTLQLVAYTDTIGNAVNNQKLSDNRALSVQNELTSNGIEIQQLKIYSKGMMAEENRNLTAKECRRVEIRY